MLKPNFSFSIFILYFLFSRVSYADIELGSTLRPTNQNNNNWNSPNNTFSLGFIPVPSTTPSLFTVAISFSDIPIWKAGGDSGVVDSNSRFEFLRNGNLRLVNGSSAVLWESNTANRGVTIAILDNFGNLSLKNGSTSIWSTFENPTDTILSGQNFTTDMILKSGSYSFILTKSGNLTLRWNTDIIYWTKVGIESSINSNLTDPFLSVLPTTGILQLNDLTLSVPIPVVYSNDYAVTGVFRFLRLDSDGNLRLYSSSGGNGKYTERWAAVQDPCLVYGLCGNLGICSYNGTTPVCSCPSRNFEFLDPNDTRKGCKRKVEISNCSGSDVTMFQLDNTVFLTYQPELSSQQFFVAVDGCRLNCQANSRCIASTFLTDGTGICYLKPSNFVSGHYSPTLPSISYVKICGAFDPNAPPSAPTLTMKPSGKKRNKQNLIIIPVVIGTFTIIVCTYFYWRWLAKQRGRDRASMEIPVNAGNKESSDPDMLRDNIDLKIFKFENVVTATNNFCETNKLGEGGFGPVYKGKFAHDGQEIAVKRLSKCSLQGFEEFKNEVLVILKLQHRNLVRLLGCCMEGEERLLIYEYMPNKSLDAFIFDSEKQALLDWRKRFQIIEGICRGMIYLHRDSRLRVIHRDLKASNILLDEELNPKISDFGMARIFGSNELQANTRRVVGTYGYMSPEYAMDGLFSEKSDVFSFGVLLLEIVSGKRNTSFYDHELSSSLLGYAWKLWTDNQTQLLIDPTLLSQPNSELEILRCIHVGLLCVQDSAKDRPTMYTALSMLISEISSLPTPKQPAFTDRRTSDSNPSHINQINACSLNNLTISDVDGR